MKIRITVCGVVQGVGFRPFVARLAEELHIGGSVRNSGGIVTIEAYGNEEAMDKFICRLRGISENSGMSEKSGVSEKGSMPRDWKNGINLDEPAYPPELPAGRIDRMVVEVLEKAQKDEVEMSAAKGSDPHTSEESSSPAWDFQIIESENENPADLPLIPADLPTCGDCLREMRDPANRRFRYPFISCVNCGPRYSILEKLPYDREQITMRDFEMCPDCEAEYTRRSDRRRHAQTISCRECGPQLLVKTRTNDTEFISCAEGNPALHTTINLLNAGKILALKGIGGYQFVCRPDCEDAILRLRELKGREKKPFAVMFSGMSEIKKYCQVSDAEEKLLRRSARPIVLMTPKRAGDTFLPDRSADNRSSIFAPSLSSESRYIGAFLPYTGLHQLLTENCGPLVVTSANRSDDPILTTEQQVEEVWENFPELVDGIAWNRRRIVTPLDDSLMRVTGGRTQMLRRSRGFVPQPVSLKQPAEKNVLAFGGDLKAVFGLAAGNRFYPSQYFGDLENYRVSKNYERELERMQQLLGIRPQLLVCDLHPGYLSGRLAQEAAQKLNLPLLQVQHHHAHAASVMAEHGLEHCLAFVFDGTGYGTDGHVWGGEFLLCSGEEFQRVGHLNEITLCGGDLSARDAELTAACHLIGAEKADSGRKSLTKVQENDRENAAECSWLPAANREMQESQIWKKQKTAEKAIKWNINTEKSTSMGRLFDAVSALLGIRSENSYEGECAIALENAAAHAKECGREAVPLTIPVREEADQLIADRTELIRQLAQYAGMWENRSQELALGFHEAVALMVLQVSCRVRERTGENCIALSGGVFANVILLERCMELLEQEGFSVYVNEQVPGNDGGICLGQAWLAVRMNGENKLCV